VVITGAQGVGAVDRPTLASMMKDDAWQLREFQLMDARVQMVGEDVAIVAYRVHEELLVDGEPVSLDATDASTWVRQNGAWRCALHTESLAGDPFGRDRKHA